MNDLLREKKDEAVEKLRRKYATREKQLEKRIDRAMDKVDKEKVDVKTKTGDTIISFGLAAMGALFGRKTFSSTNASKAARGIRNAGRVAKEKQDVARAEENLAQLQIELEELGAEIEARVDELSEEFSPDNYEPETFAIKPRRSDIFNVEVCLLWEMRPPVNEV